MAPTIGVAMIVRDEAAVIERCLASVRPLVDTWTIVDTGSADDTLERVRASLDGMRGTLVEEPWVDFGHNRTSLMGHARGSADYLLLVDADMVVTVLDELPALTADAYHLRHVGDLRYAVPRLVRGDREWHYVGATHEYLASPRPFSISPLDAWVIEHHADGGSRGDKFERDRRLLEAALAETPDDPRSLFYLAQTYRDLGETGRAIETYRRRVAVGGWDEETFYAQFQLGLLLAAEDPSGSHEALLTAWQMRPTRAEPLLELARSHRNRGEHHLAELYARRGRELPPPDDLLFVHREAYDWALTFEHAIALYWTGDVFGARQLNTELLAGGVPPEIEPWVRHNLAWCNQALDELDRPRPAWSPDQLTLLGDRCPDLTVTDVTLDLEAGWSALNPSIGPDGTAMVVRTVNYRRDDHGVYTTRPEDGGLIRTRNRFLTLDEDLRTTSDTMWTEVPEGPPRFASRVWGCEDVRLVAVDGHWVATATVRDRNDGEWCEMALLTLASTGPGRSVGIEGMAVLDAGRARRHEKNWMPFAVDGELHLVYSCDPLVVLHHDLTTATTSTVTSSPGPPGAASFRGGSQGLPDGDGWLFVVHEVVDPPRTYAHRLVRLERDFTISGVSAPFSFSGAAIEFCAGLAAVGDDVVLSYGVKDRSAHLARLPRASLRALLT
jgi:tetratricopeptide (TPR) repeat protein